MTARTELHRLVDRLGEKQLGEALQRLSDLSTENGDLAEAVAGDTAGEEHDGARVSDRIRAGRATSVSDPLWRIVGIGRSADPTDVRRYKDEYLADAFDPRKP
jgi:hypothetical protein